MVLLLYGRQDGAHPGSPRFPLTLPHWPSVILQLLSPFWLDVGYELVGQEHRWLPSNPPLSIPPCCLVNFGTV